MQILGISCLLFTLVIGIAAPEKRIDDKENDWRWITLLKTQREEIEKVYGESITEDKSRMYQTYVTKFGKINVSYVQKDEFREVCDCTVTAGTVSSIYVSLGFVLLSEIDYDLTKFKRDGTFYPREVSYYDADSGIYIGTEMVRLKNGDYVERVFAIAYSPVRNLFKKESSDHPLEN